MPYFIHNVPLVSGTTVRAAPLNVIFDAIQTGFELLPDAEASEKGFSGTVYVGDAVTDNHAVNLRTLQNLPTFAIPQMDFGANRIKNILDPVDDQDAATKIWAINQTSGIVAAATAAQLAAEVSRDSAAADAVTASIQSSNAATSASAASVSESMSENWANEAEDVLVDATQYSAFHWAKKAEASAAGVVSVADVVGLQTELDNRLPLVGGALTGPVTTTSTIDGRDIAADGAKLDLIDSGYLLSSKQVTTSYTLVLADAGSILEMNNAAANTVVIPTNAVAPIPVDTRIDVYQHGAGTTSISGAGVSLLGGLNNRGQYEGLSLWKRATDEWVVFGGV